MATQYLACDLGAESGRLVLGRLDNGRLMFEEIHRVPNRPFRQDGSLVWDLSSLYAGLEDGLRKAAARGDSIRSISTDSWGVDYLLLDAEGHVIPPTYHYRDERTQRGIEEVFRKIDWAALFAETGIQFMPINTIYQLAAESPGRLERAAFLIGIGDGFNYWLSGVCRAEVSLASTTQLYNPIQRDWSAPLLDRLGLPRRIFPEIVPSGTRLAPLATQPAQVTGLGGLEVVASCSHDTGAAVAAVPASEGSWAYLSSGTWSLMGAEVAHPILTDRCRELNFTNEIGYGGSIRLLKNIIGLWMVQECRRHWAEQGTDYDYATLTQMAAEAPAFRSLIHPGDPRFLSPGEMPDRVAAMCRELDQPVPRGPAEMIRAILESLALLYRRTLSQIEELVGHPIERLHIVGGGSQNSLLNQFTANATQIPVDTGPVEATALGNLLVQALALEDLSSLDEARSVVRKSVDLARVEPQASKEWQAAYQRFERLVDSLEGR